MASRSCSELGAFKQAYQQSAGRFSPLSGKLAQLVSRDSSPMRQHGIAQAAQVLVFRAQIQHNGANGTALAETAFGHALCYGVEQSLDPTVEAAVAPQGLTQVRGNGVAVTRQRGGHHLRLAAGEVVVQRALRGL
jgi:hypothetical protein